MMQGGGLYGILSGGQVCPRGPPLELSPAPTITLVQGVRRATIKAHPTTPYHPRPYVRFPTQLVPVPQDGLPMLIVKIMIWHLRKLVRLSNSPDLSSSGIKPGDYLPTSKVARAFFCISGQSLFSVFALEAELL